MRCFFLEDLYGAGVDEFSEMLYHVNQMGVIPETWCLGLRVETHADF